MTTTRGSYTAWYQDNFHLLSGHGLWLRGGEPNTLPVDEYDKRACRVLITRLSTYLDTSESFTHTLLYQIARGIDGVFPDLAYLPPPNDAAKMTDDNIPWLLGTQAKRGPNGYDLIALSNSIVQELINVPVMLERSGIPLGKAERMADPGVPLIILGGANALHSTVFWNDNPPIDGVFIGESIACIRGIFEICRDAKAAGQSKRQTLERLESIDGFILPDKPRPTRRIIERTFAGNALMAGAPVLFAESRAGAGTLQISEGCACFCSFCAEAWGRKPYREAAVEELGRDALAMKAGQGLDKIDLFSFNFGMHAKFYELLQDLAVIVPAIGLKSQRFDSIAGDPALLPALHAMGKTSITCGLEGISPRLRRYLHKSLDETGLTRAFSYVCKAPLRELKIFLVAAGNEDDADFREFVNLVTFIASEHAKSASKPRIVFSLTPLVRFPGTPLEFEDAPAARTLRPIIGKIKSIVHAAKFEFRLSAELEEYELSQIMVRAEDARVGSALVNTIRSTGFVYYREVPRSLIGSFCSRLESAGLPLDQLLKSPSDQAHWALVDTGVSRAFLKSQHAAAVAFIDKGYCSGAADKEGACSSCGACGSPAERRLLTRPRKQPAFQVDKFKDMLRALTAQETAVCLLVDIDDRAAGVPRAIVSAVVASAIMQEMPEIVPAYRGSGKSFWEERGAPWVVGDDVMPLKWLSSAVDRISALVNDPARLAVVNRGMQGWGIVRSLADTPPSWARLVVESPYHEECARFCAASSLKYQHGKQGERGFAFAFTAPSVGKRILKSLVCTTEAGGLTKVNVVAGEKFDPSDFAKTAFNLPGPDEWVRIKMRACFDE